METERQEYKSLIFKKTEYENYKFRGKRKSDGTWVYGYFGKDYSERCIISSYLNAPNEAWEVDPETVGQFTGLTDKNKIEICEGDIVRYIGNELGDRFTDEVKYNEACFNPITAICWMSDIEEAECEIVGNIHDNPELLIQE